MASVVRLNTVRKLARGTKVRFTERVAHVIEMPGDNTPSLWNPPKWVARLTGEILGYENKLEVRVKFIRPSDSQEYTCVVLRSSVEACERTKMAKKKTRQHQTIKYCPNCKGDLTPIPERLLFQCSTCRREFTVEERS